MKNLLSIVCMFTVIAYQSAHARDYYGYERVGRDDSDYIYINNERTEERVQRAQPRHFVRLDAEQSNEARRRVLNTGVGMSARMWGLTAVLGRLKYKQELDKELLGKASKRVGRLPVCQFNQYVGWRRFNQIGNTKEKRFLRMLVSFLDVTLKDTLDFTAYGFDLMGYIPIQRRWILFLGLAYGWYELRERLKERLITMSTIKATRLKVS